MSMILILTQGLPRSGKSTWARKQGDPIVNPDSIRLAMHGQRYSAKAEPFVWAMAYTMTEALFLAGHQTVIVDATNNTEKRRKAWRDRFEPLGVDIEIHKLETTKEVCIERARLTKREDIIPVIERMAAEGD